MVPGPTPNFVEVRVCTFDLKHCSLAPHIITTYCNYKMNKNQEQQK